MSVNPPKAKKPTPGRKPLPDTPQTNLPTKLTLYLARNLAVTLIRSAVDLEAVIAWLSIKVQLGKAIESFLYREPPIYVVHIVVDDHVMKLLRLTHLRR